MAFVASYDNQGKEVIRIMLGLDPNKPTVASWKNVHINCGPFVRETAYGRYDHRYRFHKFAYGSIYEAEEFEKKQLEYFKQYDEQNIPGLTGVKVDTETWMKELYSASKNLDNDRPKCKYKRSERDRWRRSSNKSTKSAMNSDELKRYTGPEYLFANYKKIPNDEVDLEMSLQYKKSKKKAEIVIEEIPEEKEKNKLDQIDLTKSPEYKKDKKKKKFIHRSTEDKTKHHRRVKEETDAIMEEEIVNNIHSCKREENNEQDENFDTQKYEKKRMHRSAHYKAKHHHIVEEKSDTTIKEKIAHNMYGSKNKESNEQDENLDLQKHENRRMHGSVHHKVKHHYIVEKELDTTMDETAINCTKSSNRKLKTKLVDKKEVENFELKEHNDGKKSMHKSTHHKAKHHRIVAEETGAIDEEILNNKYNSNRKNKYESFQHEQHDDEKKGMLRKAHHKSKHHHIVEEETENTIDEKMVGRSKSPYETPKAKKKDKNKKDEIFEIQKHDDDEKNGMRRSSHHKSKHHHFVEEQADNAMDEKVVTRSKLLREKTITNRKNKLDESFDHEKYDYEKNRVHRSVHHKSKHHRIVESQTDNVMYEKIVNSSESLYEIAEINKKDIQTESFDHEIVHNEKKLRHRSAHYKSKPHRIVEGQTDNIVDEKVVNCCKLPYEKPKINKEDEITKHVEDVVTKKDLQISSRKKGKTKNLEYYVFKYILDHKSPEEVTEDDIENLTKHIVREKKAKKRKTEQEQGKLRTEKDKKENHNEKESPAVEIDNGIDEITTSPTTFGQESEKKRRLDDENPKHRSDKHGNAKHYILKGKENHKKYEGTCSPSIIKETTVLDEIAGPKVSENQVSKKVRSEEIKIPEKTELVDVGKLVHAKIPEKCFVEDETVPNDEGPKRITECSSVREKIKHTQMEGEEQIKNKEQKIMDNILPNARMQNPVMKRSSTYPNISHSKMNDENDEPNRKRLPFLNWLANKNEQAERLSIEQRAMNIAKAKHMEERASLSQERFRRWCANKEKELQHSKSTLSSVAATSRCGSSEEEDVERRLAKWEREKLVAMRALREKEEARLAQQRAAEVKRQEESTKAYLQWKQVARLKPKPVPMGMGLDSLRGTNTPHYTNPNEWKSLLSKQALKPTGKQEQGGLPQQPEGRKRHTPDYARIDRLAQPRRPVAATRKVLPYRNNGMYDVNWKNVPHPKMPFISTEVQERQMQAEHKRIAALKAKQEETRLRREAAREHQECLRVRGSPNNSTRAASTERGYLNPVDPDLDLQNRAEMHYKELAGLAKSESYDKHMRQLLQNDHAEQDERGEVLTLRADKKRSNPFLDEWYVEREKTKRNEQYKQLCKEEKLKHDRYVQMADNADAHCNDLPEDCGMPGKPLKQIPWR